MKKRILSLLCSMAVLINIASCTGDNVIQETSVSQQTSVATSEKTEQQTTTIQQISETSATTEITTAETTENTTAETQQTSESTTEATTTEATAITSETTTTAEETTTTEKITATTAVETVVTTTSENTEEAESDFYAIYEAEDGKLKGALTISNDSKASGGRVVENFSSDSDYLSIEFEIPDDGMYDITFVSAGIGSYKENSAYIDGKQIGMFTCEDGVYTESTLPSISINKGSHEMRIVKSWGWTKLDCVIIESTQGIDDEIYNVSDKLVNGNADKRTKQLFSYLGKCYGKYILSGQVCDGGINGAEFTAIHDVTGKYPAMLGLDMMDYTPSRTALGAKSNAVERAVEFSNMGGIVTFCWHWNAPTETLKSGNDDDNGNPRWWGGFYTRNTDFDFTKALDGSDSVTKAAIDRDIAEIAKQLKRLEKENVPVIWRPLHEASGGWFWWGAQGADGFKKLWIYLYEQLTYKYECNNLIWVFNGQSGDWYPGDEYVDIIGEDIYPGNHVYSPQTARFTQATEYSKVNKIIALTENGCIFDIDMAVQVNAMWAWFNTWGGEFAVSGGKYSEKFTELPIIKKAYDSEYVLTLDELDW